MSQDWWVSAVIAAPQRQRQRLVTVAILGLLVLVGGPILADEPSPRVRNQTLRVRARDLDSGAPVPGVSVKLSAAGGLKLQALTDSEGLARFEFSWADSKPYNFLSIGAWGEGLVPLFANGSVETSPPAPPAELLFLTEKATTLGGRVLDEADQPLADAVVVLTVTKSYPGSKQRVDVGFTTVRTDASGRWSFTGVPARADSIEIGAYHLLCLTDRSAFYTEPFKPLSALRDGSAILRLRRGTPVVGTVLSPDGQPVAGAEVFYGGGRRFANAIPPIKTDARGMFTLGIKPATSSSLTARAKGFGPSHQPIRVGQDPLRVYLTLPTAHMVRGRVVDPSGNPIVGSNLVVAWRDLETSSRIQWGMETITTSLTTDADGRFEWKEAPARGVQATVSAAGYASKQSQPLASDTDQTIVLVPPTTVKGTVVDRETGEPIPQIRIVYGAVWSPGNPLIWQSERRDGVKTSKGAFEFAFYQPADQYLVRVLAEGYLPEDSGRFTPDGSPHSLTFRLTRAAPIDGTVENPDGSPAIGSIVYLVPPEDEGTIDYLELENGDVPENRKARTIHAKVGPDGRFSLAPQRGKFTLVALSDVGSVFVSRTELHRGDTLRLRPWARVSGIVTIDGKPALKLALSSQDPDQPGQVFGEPRIESRYDAQTDNEGRFEFPRVKTGRLVLGQWVPNGVERRIWFVPLATVDAEPGKTYDLKIGQSGRKVTGRLVLPRADIWMIRKAEITPSRANQGRPAPIGLQIDESGRFHAQDLRAGDYTLRIALHEPPPGNACGWGRLLGDFSRAFTIPDDGADTAIDLGALGPARLGDEPLRVGDAAPDFTVKTLDGKELKLADFQGKFVLLDFWATWCAPCVAEMPNLKAIHEKFSNDPRFVLVGLSLDERPGDAGSFVKGQGLSWLQGFTDPDSAVVAAYGATAIPATFLIGPDGKVLARDLRGETTMKTVAKALKP